MAKILLVEDNEMNRDMLSRRLERKGFQVVMAADGQQGVDMAVSEVPDLILMDMDLPIIDGWEATRRVKAGGYARDSGDRADRARDGRRSRQGDGRRLRRLRHQAGRFSAAARQDRDAVERRGQRLTQSRNRVT